VRKLTIALAVITVIALLVPATLVSAATSVGVGTGATVGTGAGSLPFIKASWVQEPDNNITLADGVTIKPVVNNLESGDTSHLTAGTQINPPVIFNASKTIDFFAVVSDPAGVANLSAAVGGDVFGYVFSPANSPLPYSTPTDPTFGAPNYKFKTEFTYDLGSGATAIAALTAAYNAHLVNFGPVAAQDPNIAQEGAVLGQNYTFANLHNSSLTGELDKHVAELYEGVGVLTYEQPAGTYSIDVYAIDKSGNVSVKLTTPFYYLPVPAVETDFTSITYGNVSLRVPLTIPGDVTWGNNIATVRNIGNTWVQVTVAQDDMGFGKAGTQVATAYKGTVPPVFSSTPSGNQSNWNVYFDAILGTNVEMYFDPTAKGSSMTNVVTLPGILDLSTMNELDFSIFINDGMGVHAGSLTVSAVSVPFVAGTVPPLMGGVNTQSSEPAITPIPPVVTTP
jgi:hypothetical protein